MPVYVNKSTGLAENLSPVQEQIALKTNSHDVPLNDPEGNPITVDPKLAPNLLGQGYTHPDTDQINYLLKSAKYQSPEQKLKAYGEEAGRSAIPLGGFTKAETMLGVNPEEIRSREEQLSEPEKFVSGMAGLVGSEAIPVVGQAGLLKKVGEVGEAVGGLGGKIPGYAAKYAAENAAFQLGDEASKAFMGAPDTATDFASNVLMGGLIGGALGGGIGVIGKSFDVFQGTNVAKALEAIRAKSTGEVISPLTEDIEHAGVTLPPEIKASMEAVPELKQVAQHLRESPTHAGREFQESLDNFHSEASNAAAQFLGHTPESVDALSNYSENKAGSAIQEALISDLEKKVSPFSKTFDSISEKYSAIPLNDAEKLALGENLSEAGQRFMVTPSAPEASKITQMIKEVPNINTLEDLRNFSSNHLSDISRKEMYGIASPIRGVLRNIEDVATTRILGEKAPELIAEHSAARAGWRAASETVDELNDALHVGKYRNVKGFIEKLREMQPEKVLNRLTPVNNANLLNTLNEKFPEIAQGLKQHYLNEALQAAAKRRTESQPINLKNLFNVIGTWSPELRSFALSRDQMTKLSALKSLVDRLPMKANPSGTAGTLASLLKKWPSGVMSMISLAMGHSPITGFFLGELGRIIGTEAPDALKLATLRFLGSDAPINSRAFKSMTHFANAVVKGESLLGKSIKGVFHGAAIEIPHNLIPDEKTREKLDNRVSELNEDPSKMLNINPEFSHYMPEHGQAVAQSAARMVNYLNNLRPKTAKQGPLDSDRVPSSVEKAQYNRALDIASQPLLVLKSIKEATLTPKDVVSLHTMYPGLYKQMANRLTSEMISVVDKKGNIPYSQRMALGLFLGQPLDSTMTPKAVLSIQMTHQMSAPQMPQGATKSLPKGGVNNLQKLASMDQLSSASSQAHRTLKS